REAFALCPNFVLYWEVIRFGCETGYRTLDLGRSFKNAGTHEFKRQWGAVDHTLPWISIDTAPGAAPPVDRDASRFAPMIAAWKRLPVPVANLVGPWIRGQVPTETAAVSTPVTIAILNYQRRDALRRALEAARGQRYAPLEILAVDN